MKSQTILDGLSVVTASLILMIGVSLIAGLLMAERIPGNYRYTLGGLMTAYALYRIGMAVVRLRRASGAGGSESDDGDIDEPHEPAR